MKHRKLRIAWSVAWGLLAVLLCVLWVRTYSGDLIYDFPIVGRTGVGLALIEGSVTVQFGDSRNRRSPAYELTVADLYSTASVNYATIPPPPLPPVRRASFLLGHAYARAPFWIVTLLAASMAVAPWLRFRYSLRTLLIATTLIAVVLGIIGWMSRVG